MDKREQELQVGIRYARIGALANAVLALGKGVAGVLGNSHALIADAVESLADIAGSLVVWGGLRFSAQSPDQDHPYGHGKAEPLAAAIVGLMLCIAAMAIFLQALAAILNPHAPPAGYTLIVLVVVILIKETLFRRLNRAASDSGSRAMQADAWHHRADAFTSVAAFLGISVALIGGPGWVWADGAAACVAAVIIAVNGYRILSPAVHELMDGAPPTSLMDACAVAARSVPGVLFIEQLKARKVGTRYLVDMHVQADPALSLHDAHILSGCVKTAIRTAVPVVENVLVHMEPFEGLP